MSFRLALVQLSVSSQKAQNLSRAALKVKEAVSKGAKVVSLPECFNSPYGTKFFPEYAEKIPDGPSCKALSDMAKQNEVYVVGGSIPERDGEQLFNTSTIWSPTGDLIGKFRKIHLFDIDIPGKIQFKESENLSPGNEYFMFEAFGVKIGIGICYDIRFAELAQIYAKKGCQLLLYPGAFNMTTGPAHWELLARARAVDNQVYVALPSPARDTEADYIAWGNSSIVDPWGKVVSKAKNGDEEIIYADIDTEYLNEIRMQIPITRQKRGDLYELITKNIEMF